MKKNFVYFIIMKDRIILHCDLNNFFASVEMLLHPELQDVPMAVAGDPTKRHGIILSKNELAKAKGVKTAETIWQAKAKCPNLSLVIPHHNKYSEYSKKVFAVYERYTDMIEPFGCDEAWLDMTMTLHNFNKTPKEFADFLRETIHNELGLTISVGVSFNKVFAKLGSDYKKPNATTVITRETGKKIVFPLPASDLLFVGRKAKETLTKLGIQTIGELAKYDVWVLEKHLGKLGRTIHRYANGQDSSPVQHKDHYEPPKSVGNGRTFEKDIATLQEVRHEVYSLANEIGHRLRKHSLYANCIHVATKTPNFKVKSKQHIIENSTHSNLEIAEHAFRIIQEIWSPPAPLRSITITAANLTPQKSIQQSLFFDTSKHEKLEKIDDIVDKVQKKYNWHTITFGTD